MHEALRHDKIRGQNPVFDTAKIALTVLAVALSGCGNRSLEDENAQLSAENARLQLDLAVSTKKASDYADALRSKYAETMAAQAEAQAEQAHQVTLYYACAELFDICPNGLEAAGKKAAAAGVRPNGGWDFWSIFIAKTCVLVVPFVVSCGALYAFFTRKTQRAVTAEAKSEREILEKIDVLITEKQEKLSVLHRQAETEATSLKKSKEERSIIDAGTAEKTAKFVELTAKEAELTEKVAVLRKLLGN